MENTKVSFRGQTFFIGIDVHKKSWTVTIMHLGMILKTFSMNPDPYELSRKLKRDYPEAEYRSVYEAGTFGFWIHRKLTELGIKNIIVNPADIPSRQKERRRKTDRADSQKLARELSSGNLEGIYIPPADMESLRGLSRQRIQFTRDQTRMKCRIKSFLLYQGIPVPENKEMTHWSRRFIEYLRALELDDINDKSKLDGYLDALLEIRKVLLRTTLNLRKAVRANKEISEVIDNIKSVPGVGFITAITFYTEIIDINRFSKFDKLCCYIGLAPSIHSSGETEKTLGLSKQQKRYIRNLIIEASWTAIRKDPALLMSFNNLSGRMKSQKAIIRIAKKLLSRIAYVWRKQGKYTYSLVS